MLYGWIQQGVLGIKTFLVGGLQKKGINTACMLANIVSEETLKYSIKHDVIAGWGNEEKS